MAGAAVAANAALVAEAVRCMPLPASRMPEHAVPLGHERFSACAEDGKGDEANEPDFTVFLTRPCLSIDQVRDLPAFDPSGFADVLLNLGLKGVPGESRLRSFLLAVVARVSRTRMLLFEMGMVMTAVVLCLVLCPPSCVLGLR